MSVKKQTAGQLPAELFAVTYTANSRAQEGLGCGARVMSQFDQGYSSYPSDFMDPLSPV